MTPIDLKTKAWDIEPVRGLDEAHYCVCESEDDYAATRVRATVRAWRIREVDSGRWWIIDWNGSWQIRKRKPSYQESAQVIRAAGVGRFDSPSEAEDLGSIATIDATIMFGDQTSVTWSHARDFHLIIWLARQD